MLKSFALRLSRSGLWLHLFLLALTLATITLIGYHVGTFDQVVHIPFLKKFVDPTLFPNDPFFDLRFEHFSYFWFFFQPFYRLGILEPVMFGVHVAATYLTFWALWSLTDLLFKNPLTNVLAVAAFVVPHIGFAGFPPIEFSLLNRTFVLPFLLWALIFFLRRRYLLAFGLLGVMYNLHVISVNFALAMLLLAGVVQWRKVGWRNLVAGMALFVVCALPVLLWKAGKSPVDLTARWEWFSIISRGTLYNLFFLFAPYVHILVITLCGVSALVLFFLARRRRPSPEYDRTVALFVWAVIIILAVEVVSAQWWPATILVQSQIIRAGLLGLILGYVYFANYIVTRWEAGELSGVDSAVLAATLVASPLPFVPLLTLACQRLIASLPWRRAVTVALLPVTFAASLGLVMSLNLWGPGLYIYPHQSPWYAAQVWAKDNTPKDTLFITPPQIYSFYDSDWRVYSERSTVVTLSELLEAAFMPNYLFDHTGSDGQVVYGWKTRFADFAPGALEKFRGDFFENERITAQAFYNLTPEQLLALAYKYHARYLVVEKPHAYPWTVVYENSQYVIYKLP